MVPFSFLTIKISSVPSHLSLTTTTNLVYSLDHNKHVPALHVTLQNHKENSEHRHMKEKDPALLECLPLNLLSQYCM